jgi:hypothetical protein
MRGVAPQLGAERRPRPGPAQVGVPDQRAAFGCADSDPSASRPATTGGGGSCGGSYGWGGVDSRWDGSPHADRAQEVPILCSAQPAVTVRVE